LQLDEQFWSGRKVLLTGHTGFKGAWLACWLNRLGAQVHGFSLAPTEDNVLQGLLDNEFVDQRYADLRDHAATAEAIETFQPEIVLHLAAQALVRRSYADPVETFASNVMGTVHLLEAVRKSPSIKAVLVATTDKVYENEEAGEPFGEDDRLGGHDPYSTSKAATELVVASYRKSFFSELGSPVIATARAGNVIGGGDWSQDRIVPDIVRASRAGTPVRLRYPHAVRPWLHVLEPLGGYLMMVQRMAATGKAEAETLNFAPDPTQSKTVADLVDAYCAGNGGQPGWAMENAEQPKEAGLLLLSPAKARAILGWRPQLSFEETVEWTADWYRRQESGEDPRELTVEQIDRYGARLDGASETSKSESMAAQ
jgi:CDP-glucose 4,6-dehydratase